MAKMSYDDKMLIQTLQEQGSGARAIRKVCPEKGYCLVTAHNICRRVDNCGSAVKRKAGSRRPKPVRTTDQTDQIASVSELICSQEDQPGTSMGTHQISREIRVSRSSVWRIARKDLGLNAFK